jgi:putative ABC transport system permease protein
MDEVVQDLKYGLRALRHNKGFTAVALLTLTLGIGANTALFSVVDAVLLRPLPFPQPQELVAVQDDLTAQQVKNVGMSQPEIDDLQKSSGVFQEISAAWPIDANVTGGEKPERIEAMAVSFNYFEMLGVKPELGRFITSQDYAPGFTQDAVISDGLWRRMFGGDPKAIGKQFRIDGDEYVIVGVMGLDFRHPGPTLEHDVECWVAAGYAADPFPVPPSRDIRMLPTAIGRLQRGMTVEQAQAKLNAFVGNLTTQYPGSYPAAMGWQVRLEPLKKDMVGKSETMLVILLSAVGLVLLIACVNIAALLLARSSGRHREFAVRRALGAGSARLIRQTLTESVVLSLAGGALGLLADAWLQGALLHLMPERLPRIAEIHMSGTVLAFTMGLALLTGILFGIAPALQLSDPKLMENLKEGGRGGLGSRQSKVMGALIVSEVALSLVLMVGAGLLLRSFWNLLSVSPGFRPDNVVVSQIWLPTPNNPMMNLYPNAPKQAALSREIIRRVSALPGVKEVAIGTQGSLPLSRAKNLTPIVIDGRQPASAAEAPTAEISSVTPDYFKLLGTPLLAGRFFSETDNETTERAALIDETMAQRYFPNEDPVGKSFHFANVPASFQPQARKSLKIVGVVGKMKSGSLDEPFTPHVYQAVFQSGVKILTIFVRTSSSAEALAEPLRREVQAVDPTLPVFGVRTLESVVTDSLAARRFAMLLLAFFAATAMILASIGIYGVMAYYVTQRMREIGIRIALGAGPQEVINLVVGRGVWLTATGIGIGIVGAALLTRSLQSLVFGVKPFDPATLVTGAVVLVAVGAAACFVPARRAMRVDPVMVLRAE